MNRKVVALVCMLAVVGFVSSAMAGDCPGCKKVSDEGQGYCCGKGQAYGVQLTSQKLHQALEGKKIDRYKVKCPGCKTASKTNGSCKGCNVHVADGKAYKSKVSQALAKGKPVSAEKAAYCGGCKTAHKHDTQCTGCGVGFVSGRMYKGDDYKVALAAHKTLVKASQTSKKCEACAVAMVTDGECAHCKVEFKDGTPSKKG